MEEKAFTRAVSALPSLTAVLKRIYAVINDAKSSALDITRVLQLDPAIAGKVLRLANSAYVGLPNTVSSIQNAVTLLGTSRIRSLILVSTFSSVKISDCFPFSVISYWRHSVCTALIAEAIAKSLRRYDCVIDEYELFSAAILHDIGKLIAAIIAPEDYKELYRQSVDNDVPFFMMEKGETAHGFLGAHYAEQWGFPNELKECIQMHHKPLSGTKFGLRVSIIHVADIMAHVLGFKIFPGEITPLVQQDVLSLIGLPLERLKVIAQSVIEDQKSIESLMETVDLS